MYFKPAPGDDTALRVLEVKKNNYGPVNESILLRWRDGVYVVEPGKGTLERLAAEAEVDHLFIKLLRRFTEQGRNVSDKKSPTYAPSQFAEEPEAKAAKVTKKASPRPWRGCSRQGGPHLTSNKPDRRDRTP